MNASNDDLLKNFATWPEHIQQSFLSMVSRQITIEQVRSEEERRTQLDEIFEEFDVLLGILADKITGLMEDVPAHADEYDHLREIVLREGLIHKLRRRQRQLLELETLLTRILYTST